MVSYKLGKYLEVQWLDYIVELGLAFFFFLFSIFKHCQVLFQSECCELPSIMNGLSSVVIGFVHLLDFSYFTER